MGEIDTCLRYSFRVDILFLRNTVGLIYHKPKENTGSWIHALKINLWTSLYSSTQNDKAVSTPLQWSVCITLDVYSIPLLNWYFQWVLSVWARSWYPHKFMIATQLFNSSFEFLHSVFGLVPTPIPTLILQSFARLIILVGICYVIPESPANYNIFTFAGLTLAWSITEIIRYGFYVLKLGKFTVPYSILWLRYSAFFILYPLGLVCESATVYNSYEVIESRLPGYSKFLKYALPLYIPGFCTCTATW